MDCEKDSISEVSASGAIVEMISGQVYKIDDVGQVDSSLWLPADDVLICSQTVKYQGKNLVLYQIINKDEEGEEVGAVLLNPGGRSGPKPPSTPGTGGTIDTRIDGEFKGWEGETIYKMQNGQIWQQSSYHYHYHYAYAPEVLIYPSGGGYKIHVVDDDDEDVSVRLL